MLCWRYGLLMSVTLLAVLITGCQNKQTTDPATASDSVATLALVNSVIQQMVAASGLDQFDQITEIQFTFNVRKRDRTIQRKWTWHPKQDKVTLTYTGLDDQELSLSYIRGDIASNTNTKHDLNRADRWFINDSFWLMLPLHLSWQNQQDLTVTDHGMANYPLPKGSGRHITVAFKNAQSGGGGYSPGDIYELFLDDQNLIAQWIFRKGGSDKPTLINTFEKYARIGPCRLALNHKNPQGFKLWFTGIKVMTDH
ncbi:MAG: hypothetical protein JKX85_10750 [Phycisphaeraceae bacterium]|nr:hypothetical protein [Phycisphaeraceae bacterium]